jgi:hypothetical protein
MVEFQHKGARLLAFLSYDSKDTELVVQFAHRVRPFGVDAWRDQSHIHPGTDWHAAIMRALALCDLVLAFLSAHSLQNQRFLVREWELALQIANERARGTPFIIPVRLEPCPMPEALAHLHAYDVFEPSKFSPFITCLAELKPIDRGVRAELAIAINAMEGLVQVSPHQSRLSEATAGFDAVSERIIRVLVDAKHNHEARELAAISPHPAFRTPQARATNQISTFLDYLRSVLTAMRD